MWTGQVLSAIVGCVIADKWRLTRRVDQAVENRAFLHRLLREKEPEFLGALELATALVDAELSAESPDRCTASALRSRLDLRLQQAV
jgi:hypothetical protein